MKKRIFALLLALWLLLCAWATGEVLVDGDVAVTEDLIVEYGYDYYTPDEVALYLLQKETITGDELMTYVNADKNSLPEPKEAPEA